MLSVDRLTSCTPALPSDWVWEETQVEVRVLVLLYKVDDQGPLGVKEAYGREYSWHVSAIQFLCSTSHHASISNYSTNFSSNCSNCSSAATLLST